MLSAWNLQDVLLQANQSNMPFGYVMPASGAPVLVDGIAAVKGGNTAGAQKFMEFLFDDKLRADLAKDYFQIPAVDDRREAGVAGPARPQAAGRRLGRHRQERDRVDQPLERPDQEQGLTARACRAGPAPRPRPQPDDRPGPVPHEGEDLMIDVTLESVSKRFARVGDTAAVDDVDITIAAGEFFTLLGPSGCGKTTTLRMVAGFYFPTSGADPVRQRGRHPPAAEQARHRHGVPELRALPAHDAWRRTSRTG